MSDQQTRERVIKIQALLDQLDQEVDPQARQYFVESIQALMELHGAAFARLVALLADDGQAGKEILGKIAEDESISGLLVLYGVHPVSISDRVKRALEEVRSTLQARNADAEMLSFADGVVRIRLVAGNNGCHSSGPPLKQFVEDVVMSAAPDVVDLVVEEVAPEPKPVFVTLQGLKKRNAA